MIQAMMAEGSGFAEFAAPLVRVARQHASPESSRTALGLPARSSSP